MTFKKIARVNGVTDDVIKTIINGIRKNGEEVIDEKKLSQNKSTL